MSNGRNTGLTRALAEFIAHAGADPPPGYAVRHAEVAFMDWVAVTVAGRTDPLVDRLLGYADLMGGREQATIIGRGVRKSLDLAALINGAASHALDYDDTIGSYIAHPSVTLFPALLLPIDS